MPAILSMKDCSLSPTATEKRGQFKNAFHFEGSLFVWDFANKEGDEKLPLSDLPSRAGRNKKVSFSHSTTCPL